MGQNTPAQRTSTVHCSLCSFLAISHDPRAPYICGALGFKSRALPCVEVLRADGRECLSFEPKASTPENATATIPGSRLA